MKIRFADDRGSPVGQFVVEAENDTERTVLALFVRARENPDYEFCWHGSTYQDGTTTAFNFGLRRKAREG